MARHGGAVTFDDLWLATSDKDALELVASWAAPEDLSAFARDLDDWPTFQRNVSGLVDNLSEFASGELRERLCSAEPDILLEEAHAQNAIVYFELNSQMRPVAAASLARVVLE